MYIAPRCNLLAGINGMPAQLARPPFFFKGVAYSPRCLIGRHQAPGSTYGSLAGPFSFRPMALSLSPQSQIAKGAGTASTIHTKASRLFPQP